ncbi:hypothetical protein C8T65DRAFT_534797, partial [Cerioporus squamosus]
TYTLVAASVPIEFNPAAPSAAESLWLENSGVVPAKDSLRGLRWLHPIHPGTQRSSKREGTLVFSVQDRAVADFLISKYLAVRGAVCKVSKYVPPPLQCYHCQAFGHTAKACPHISSPSSVRCGRCAAPHPLKDCLCPAKNGKC